MLVLPISDLPQAQEAAVPLNLISCCPVILILYTAHKPVDIKDRQDFDSKIVSQCIIGIVRVTSFHIHILLSYPEKEHDRCLKMQPGTVGSHI